jgi:hypothetical protein
VVRGALFEDPRARLLSDRLRVPVLHIVGALVRLWLLAEETADERGVLAGMRWEDVDRFLALPGFSSHARAIPSWFAITPDGFFVCVRYTKTDRR